MTDDDVHTALVRWLGGLTGLTVIKSHQGGPMPALPYIMVNFTGMVPVRQHAMDREFTEATGAITEHVTIESEWGFSLHSYGTNPTSMLRPIVTAYEVAQRQEPLLPSV